MHRFDRTQTAAAIVLFVLFLVTGGCGYRNMLVVPPQASDSSEGIDGAPRDGAAGRPRTSIAVIALQNDTPEPWLDRILTDAMRREISARAGFEFINDPNGADLVLRGRIRQLDTRSVAFSRFVAAVEYGVTLNLDLELLFAGGNIVRLDPRMLSEADSYLASADIEVTRTNRLEVLRRLSDLLASRVADSIEMIESPIPESGAEGGG